MSEGSPPVYEVQWPWNTISMYYASIWWSFGKNGILRQEYKTQEEMTTESDQLWIWTSLIRRFFINMYDDDDFFGGEGWGGVGWGGGCQS